MKTQILKLTTVATLACGLLMATGMSGYGAAPNWVFVDEFDNGIINRSWGGPYGGPNAWMAEATETNGQFTIQVDWPATNPDNIGTTVADWWLSPRAPAIADGETLEITADMVSVNQDDAYGYIGMDSDPVGGYGFLKDQNELFLFKWGGGGNAFFFWEEQEIKNENVRLVFALTRDGSNLVIQTRVLDLENGNQILWEKTVIDTPASDPVLPNRARKGLLMEADMGAPWFGTPSPFGGGNNVYFGLWQFRGRGTGLVEIVYDRFEASEFDMALTLAKSASPDELILSWPRTGVEHVVFESDSCEGPWELLPLPIQNDGEMNWVTIPAVASEKYFRLVQGQSFFEGFTGGMKPGWETDYLGKTGWPDYVSFGVTNDQFRVTVAPQPYPMGTNNSVPYVTFMRPDIDLKDLSMSVDILAWDDLKSPGCGFLALDRADGSSWGAFGVSLYRSSGVPKARLWTWTSSGLQRGTAFTIDPAWQYRMVLTASDGSFTIELFNLEDLTAPVGTLSKFDDTMVRGPIGLYFGDGRSGPNGGFEITIDDFIAVGTATP